MKAGTPIHSETIDQTVKRKTNLAGPIFAAVIFGGAGLAFAMFKVSKKDREHENGGEKTRREIADDEKKKLTPSEMGKLGAKKRWDKKKKEQEAKDSEDAGEDDDPAIQT